MNGDGLFSHQRTVPEWLMARKIDRSLSIDDETALNPNRANFPLKSKAKNFDGSTVGF